VGLHSIRLRNFRTFSDYELEFDPEATTLLLSPNGTGKTSILEAIYVMATGSSFRTSSSGDLIKTASEKGAANALAFHEQRRLEFDVVLSRGARAVTKKITVNKQKPHSLATLYESFPVTVFTPEGVDMVRRDPAGRRDYITHLAITLDPRVADAVERFERVLKQRNALLRSLSGELPFGAQADELNVWNEEFVIAGHDVVTARENALSDVAPIAAQYYRDLADGRGAATLLYERSWQGDLHTALRSEIRRDVQRGYSTIGPHRDDMSILLDGRDARRQASQGEQRSLALALLLAGDALVRRERNITPLLMLDDVFSELDPIRSTRLLTLLPAGQTLVTAAAPLPTDLLPAVVVDVTKGSL
jgi:DNA replication and repair protein RecF